MQSIERSISTQMENSGQPGPGGTCWKMKAKGGPRCARSPVGHAEPQQLLSRLHSAAAAPGGAPCLLQTVLPQSSESPSQICHGATRPRPTHKAGVPPRGTSLPRSRHCPFTWVISAERKAAGPATAPRGRAAASPAHPVLPPSLV